MLCSDRPSLCESLSVAEWNLILQLAEGHHVAPFLYRRLEKISKDVPDSIIQALKRSYIQNSGRNLAVYRAFAELSEQVTRAGIPVISSKQSYGERP